MVFQAGNHGCENPYRREAWNSDLTPSCLSFRIPSTTGITMIVCLDKLLLVPQKEYDFVQKAVNAEFLS
jgi:hypothetical protein